MLGIGSSLFTTLQKSPSVWRSENTWCCSFDKTAAKCAWCVLVRCLVFNKLLAMLAVTMQAILYIAMGKQSPLWCWTWTTCLSLVAVVSTLQHSRCYSSHISFTVLQIITSNMTFYYQWHKKKLLWKVLWNTLHFLFVIALLCNWTTYSILYSFCGAMPPAF